MAAVKVPRSLLRKGETRQNGPANGRALDAHFATMSLDQILHHGQPDPAPTHFSADPLIAAKQGSMAAAQQGGALSGIKGKPRPREVDKSDGRFEVCPRPAVAAP